MSPLHSKPHFHFVTHAKTSYMLPRFFCYIQYILDVHLSFPTVNYFKDLGKYKFYHYWTFVKANVDGIPGFTRNRLSRSLKSTLGLHIKGVLVGQKGTSIQFSLLSKQIGLGTE